MLSALRRAPIQRRILAAVFCGGAGGASGCEKGGGPAGGPTGALGKAAVGILAAGGSGLALWMFPSSSFADSASERSDPKHHQIAFRDPKQGKKFKFLLGDSYRRRVFFNYERRIRMLSPPEKIFEYFASVRSPEGEVFMLPTDLMRATIPVFPPSESNIIREGHLRGEHHPSELHCAPSPFFMLFDTNNDGLISFPEEIEREEFKKVMALMRSYNRQGASHRDGHRIGLKVGGSVENGGLVEYFFGKDGKGRLQHDKFVHFLRELHDEIVRLEFAHYDFKSRGTISAKDFALSMVACADVNHINKFLDRVDELNGNPHLRDMRITFEEFKTFVELCNRLQALTLAIFGFGKVNGLLTKQDFKRAASHVCGVSVTDNVVDVIFHVFDANFDGKLSSEEFLRALQKRESAIRQPTATGLTGLLSCWLNCKRSCSVPQISM
ncbi:calcium uptake protein, mitochondrial isoform X2 [Elaeis guineensis]|uniref:Calcium uptake protein, mitochondrial isoform X2 n=1 Tax=Elaeis guineensis var. tenera TaxID=51953 RepID=A0A6I9QDZ4_ELAGV|nr:calcium uptake protein, mitochondrial isoform X2 [Elaeis guineensis]